LVNKKKNFDNIKMHDTTVEKKCNSILKVIYAVSDLRLSAMNALDYGLLALRPYSLADRNVTKEPAFQSNSLKNEVAFSSNETNYKAQTPTASLS
jgi:glutamate mutase epsilon subunit